MACGRVYMLEKKICRYLFLWLIYIYMTTFNISGGCRLNDVFCSGPNWFGSSSKR
jgi:hypothetical protein